MSTRTIPFDHCSIECIIDIKREDITRKTVSCRKIKDIDTQKFRSDVADQLGMSGECYAINVLVHNLETTLQDILEVLAPLTTTSVSF